MWMKDEEEEDATWKYREKIGEVNKKDATYASNGYYVII
jgi:hypothetical protein